MFSRTFSENIFWQNITNIWQVVHFSFISWARMKPPNGLVWVPGPYVWHPCYKLTQHYSLSLSSASGPHPEGTITPHCPLHKATPSRHWLNCNSDDRRQRRAFKRRRSSPETRWSSALLSAHPLSLSPSLSTCHDLVLNTVRVKMCSSSCSRRQSTER